LVFIVRVETIKGIEMEKEMEMQMQMQMQMQIVNKENCIIQYLSSIRSSIQSIQLFDVLLLQSLYRT
jgi:hypothetical protein